MKFIKRILFMLLIAFVGIQFIQPARNQSGQVMESDIANTDSIPSNVYARLKSSCYDCHSNNSTYPWYSNIEPIGWMLAKDIENGKAMLNFSEFGSLSSRRRVSKLRDVENRIKDGTMPLPGYLFMHPGARITEEEKKLLINWIEATIQ
jgi:hypothetical protein